MEGSYPSMKGDFFHEEGKSKAGSTTRCAWAHLRSQKSKGKIGGREPSAPEPLLPPTLGLGRVPIANGHLPASHTVAQLPPWQQNPLNVLEGRKKTEQNKLHTQAKYLMT